jgi:hypothetical protein
LSTLRQQINQGGEYLSFFTAEAAARCHDDVKRAHPGYYLLKRKPTSDLTLYNFPIGDNEKVYPSVTNFAADDALHELCLTDDVKAYERKFMRGNCQFKSLFQRHMYRCNKEKYVNDMKEPKDFFEWVESGRKARCYLCQADLSSLSAAGLASKMMDRRNSKAANGNGKKDYTRDNSIAHICDPRQIAKRVMPEVDYISHCCAVADCTRSTPADAWTRAPARSASFSAAAILLSLRPKAIRSFVRSCPCAQRPRYFAAPVCVTVVVP